MQKKMIENAKVLLEQVKYEYTYGDRDTSSPVLLTSVMSELMDLIDFYEEEGDMK
ncbi:hypothetical protein [Cytobacillus firmus]|uniref:hypothetical protein n=1 Tax=Cytobacillus firmus TaxID=1399 RepID=UPI0018CEE2DF|nr:hypothetical protein [Cytobacillus firmus]MED1906782.1 hypothetical protein [Cytobacillus firmus]